ncbi:MAG: FtsX-like permease family protein [Candidatus Neomarinimicrobiota bacterium]|nr:FtsX-like permease family protein [Candidatus Neomarinimicrobiota bacterium]
MKLSLHLALRHLNSSDKSNFSSFAGKLSIIGLSFGIASLILTMSVYQGFENTISNKIASFDGHYRFQDILGRSIDENSDLNTVLDNILSERKDPIIRSFVQGPALIRKGINAEGVIIEGFSGNGLVKPLNNLLISGTGTLSDNSIIIGKSLSDKYGLVIGDPLVIFDLSSISDISGMYRLKQFTIGGIFHSGLSEYDNNMIYTSIQNAQYLLDIEEKISGKVVYFTQNNFSSISELIDEKLRYPYYSSSWKEKHHTLFKWLEVQKLPIIIIFGMISLVAIVNIISALTMIVLDKIKTIGALQAVGFRKKQINLIFLSKGAIIGTIGSFIGLFIALVLGWAQMKYHILSISEDIYFMDHLPISFNINNVLLILILGIISSLIASYWPARIAANITPADAMKYE